MLRGWGKQEGREPEGGRAQGSSEQVGADGVRRRGDRSQAPPPPECLAKCDTGGSIGEGGGKEEKEEESLASS